MIDIPNITTVALSPSSDIISFFLLILPSGFTSAMLNFNATRRDVMGSTSLLLERFLKMASILRFCFVGRQGGVQKD
jgi:hypothetical protein